MVEPRDYANSGLDIQRAMVDHFELYPDKARRPDGILWAGRQVKTGDSISVPPTGIVRGEFVSVRGDVSQGFDIKTQGGFLLPSGKRVEHLRTWHDPELDPIVEYPFESRSGLIHISNVYRVRHPNGEETEEKWTGNAGFWVEAVGDMDRVYHASHAMADPPDFESLVFRISVSAG